MFQVSIAFLVTVKPIELGYVDLDLKLKESVSFEALVHSSSKGQMGHVAR